MAEPGRTRLPGGAPPVEIWGHFVRDGRFWRRIAAACLIWAFLALGAAAYAIRVGLYAPVAYRVDADGHAAPAGRLRAQSAPSAVEARYVARAFLKRHLSFNSLTIEADWADAWNLMTDELRAEQQRMLDRYQAQHGESFLDHVRAQGIQTDLEFEEARTETLDHNDHSWTIKLRGRIRTWPLDRAGDDTAVLTKDFESLVTLVTCPRTEATPNGLLVAKVATRTWIPDTGAAAAATEEAP